MIEDKDLLMKQKKIVRDRKSVKIEGFKNDTFYLSMIGLFSFVYCYIFFILGGSTNLF